MTRLLVGLASLLAVAAVIAGTRLAASFDVRAERGPGEPLRAVATTGMVADAVREVGGGLVRVAGLMGPGVDPHLYKASEGDVGRMVAADVVFYGGLHLEGRMAEVLERMAQRGVRTVAVTDAIPEDRLIAAGGQGGAHDPHVWFDVSLWALAVGRVRDALVEADPDSAAAYRANAARYLDRLAALHERVRAEVATVPEPQRLLVTAHDAFGYFGRAYGVEVAGIQGISTASEAGAADVSRIADLVASRRVPAVFVESSVSPRIIEALRAAVRARGFEAGTGGSLYSDALGPDGTPEGTYVGMVEHNVRTIVSALGAGGSSPAPSGGSR